MRTEEQIEAIADLNEADSKRLTSFVCLPDNAVGLNGVCKWSCYTNGSDTCLDLGITEEAGFTASEVANARERFTLATATLFELI